MPTSPHSPVSHAPRWRRRKQERPGEILEAAAAAFVERGFSATRLDDVARRAGVTKGTMYLYFDGKEALLKAVVREGIVPHIEQGERTLATHEGSSADLLRRIVTDWWSLMGHSPVGGIGKLVMAEAVNFPDLARFYHDEVVKRGHALFARVLERGIAGGEFRALDVPYTVRLVVAPLLTSAMWKHSFHACESAPLDLDRVIATHLDIFLRGIAAHPEPEHA